MKFSGSLYWKCSLHFPQCDYILGNVTTLNLVGSPPGDKRYDGFTNSWQSRYMSLMTFHITGNSIVFQKFVSRQRIHQISALLLICDGNPLVTSGYPAQRTNCGESMSWCNHAIETSITGWWILCAVYCPGRPLSPPHPRFRFGHRHTG